MALRQPDLFEETLDWAEVWFDRLTEALAGASQGQRVLPLAEEAVAACPKDGTLLLLAAIAAVLDREPERALVLLGRFGKVARAPAAPLVHALAFDQLGKRTAARALLKQHGVAGRRAARAALPYGFPCTQRLLASLDAILKEPSRASLRSRVQHSGTAGKIASARRAPAAPAGLSDPASRARPTTAEADSPPQAALPPPLPRIKVEIPLTMEIDLAPMASGIATQPDGDGRWYGLRERLAHLSLAQGYDELLCLPHLTGFEPLWHQVETVRKVLKQFRGRVLLADEVGLGKTIEAAMVLKEYALRGMAERALVLAPASLVGQWQEELAAKFGLAFATTYEPLLREDPDAFWSQNRIVASIATARRSEHAERLRARQFDLVIVDEAHHLRDRSSQSWKLVDALNKRFLLLLSATPVQNDLIELYNLLTLLKPGIFKTQKEFRAAYMTPGKPRQPANPERLRALMRDAMIRNTRAVAALKLPSRHAVTIKVDPVPGEAEAYAGLAAMARQLAAEGGVGRQRLTLHHLMGAAGSCPAAAAGALSRLAERKGADRAWGKLASRWAAIRQGGKEAALIELVRRNPQEKQLIFVHSRATLARVGEHLAEAGLAFARFDGSLSGPDKDAAIAEFRERVPILLCTQSGGEGRNIQFCNTLINFDVPWNPMAIEQRIGRIDRIGQDREVFVFNLVTRGTLEEEVLALLEEKISMFELVVGEVGAILGALEEERELPDLVLEAWLETTEAARAEAFAAIGARLEDASRQHRGAKELDEKLFGADFEAA
jgi:superfamily II DNA or RNA helicase